MHKLTAVLGPIFALAIAGAAWADTTPAPAPLDPVKLDLARQIIATTDARKQTEAMFDTIFSNTDSLVSRAMPQASREFLQQFSQDYRQDLRSMVPQMIDLTIETYARDLTETELRDMLAWSQSASGRSIQAKLPTITKDVLAGEQPMMAALLPKIMHQTIDRACEEAKCTADERQTMVAMMNQMFPPAKRPD